MSVPISLELAKAHLRIGDDTSLDALIEQYLEMAFAIAFVWATPQSQGS